MEFHKFTIFSGMQLRTESAASGSFTWKVVPPQKVQRSIFFLLGMIFGCFAWLGKKPEVTPPESFFGDEGNATRTILTDKGRIPWQAFCRGGGNVDQTESDLLQGLKGLLAAHSSPRQSKGKGKHTALDPSSESHKRQGQEQSTRSQLRIAH